MWTKGGKGRLVRHLKEMLLDVWRWPPRGWMITWGAILARVRQVLADCELECSSAVVPARLVPTKVLAHILDTTSHPHDRLALATFV